MNSTASHKDPKCLKRLGYILSTQVNKASFYYSQTEFPRLLTVWRKQSIVDAKTGGTELEAYCVKCQATRTTRELKDARAITTEDGAGGFQGTCATCGSEIVKIYGKYGEWYDIAIKVVEVEGLCYLGHKADDEWTIKGLAAGTPEGVCVAAYDTLWPYIQTLRWGGKFTYALDPDAVLVRCPDPDNRVVFEVRKVQY